MRPLLGAIQAKDVLAPSGRQTHVPSSDSTRESENTMSSADEPGQMPAIGELADSGAHPLDHVIWRALTSRHRRVAEGDRLALRYLASIAPFAATIDESVASFESLLGL